MRLPSIKTLARVFDNPREARRVLEMRHSELAKHPTSCFIDAIKRLPL